MESNLETFTDLRDGKIYKTVKIGDQLWMAENLAFEIPEKECRNNARWMKSGLYDKWCYYENNKSLYSEYGILYQWEAAKEACPPGWHLPSDEEWKELEKYLGMSSSDADMSGNLRGDIAKKLASKKGWEKTNKSGSVGINQSSNNSSGFTALPGGCRYSIDGSFFAIGKGGHWWSSSEEGSDTAWYRYLYCDEASVVRSTNIRQNGFSVRCLQD